MLVVHFEDKSSRSVSIDELTKASDLAHMLADLQGAGHDRSWAVVECLSRFQLGIYLWTFCKHKPLSLLTIKALYKLLKNKFKYTVH